MKCARVLLRAQPGRFSSMLDMGGVSVGDTKAAKLDMGKNNKIRAIALDFDLITRSIEQQRQNNDLSGGSATSAGTTKQNLDMKGILGSVVKPNTDMVQDIANLLNVKLGRDGEGKTKRGKHVEEDDDDLSLLLGTNGKNRDEEDRSMIRDESSSISNNVKNDPLNMDVRAKYARKLRDKVEGGLAGVELAKSQREDTLKQGDAPGHLAARKIAASKTVAKAGSKWMASTGTGTLLQFITSRSMKIVLLPTPNVMSKDESDTMKRAMEDLTKQLPNIKFDLMVEGSLDGSDSDGVATKLLKCVTNDVEAEPISTLVVSDRDNYLRSARDLGMYTCRVRRKNAPRGNVTTNYNTEDVSEVQDVVNKLNGISYNTVFSRS